jgi:hypothetical protein
MVSSVWVSRIYDASTIGRIAVSGRVDGSGLIIAAIVRRRGWGRVAIAVRIGISRPGRGCRKPAEHKTADHPRGDRAAAPATPVIAVAIAVLSVSGSNAAKKDESSAGREHELSHDRTPE